MDARFEDEIATGSGRRKLRIAGRPGEGRTEEYVLLEEPPEKPVKTHFREKTVPHYTSNCPHCGPEGEDDTTPYWYIGACDVSGDRVILELTEKCYNAARSYVLAHPLREPPDLFTPEPIDDCEREQLRGLPATSFKGLVVTISRASAYRSQRVLRCKQRVGRFPDWPYQTRHELARIWQVRIRPRLFKEA
jgi:hypothetical protein